MSGGVMDIHNSAGNSNALRITSDASNMESSGGKINIHLTRNSYYDIQVPNGSIPSLVIDRTTGTGSARLESNLSIAGDLTLSGSAKLAANSLSYSLEVKGDFNIDASATYDPNQNNTRFTGDTDAQFSVEGTITSNLYNWVIAKDNSTLTVAGANGNVTVRNDLQIVSGTLNDNGHTITAHGDLFNSGIHTGTGKMLLSGATATRTIGGNGNGVWGNMELNESSGISTSLTANQTVAGDFVFTAGLMNLDTYALLLQGSMMPSNITDYSDTHMFVTSGSDSGGGLIRNITQNGNWLFPVGCSRDVVRYTPALATLTDWTDEGYLQVNPVASELPLLSQTSTEPALQYYWRIRQSNFDAKPNASFVFQYNAHDIVQDGDDSGYVPGKVAGAVRTKLASGVNTTDKTITYQPAEPLANASYTAAYPSRFDGPVPVFYSRLCGSTAANWSDPTSWSETSHTGDAASRVPGSGDVVYIGNGGSCDVDGEGNFHQILTNVDVSVGEINFSPVSMGVGLPKLIVPSDRLLHAGTFAGAGELSLQVSAIASAQIMGDMGTFCTAQQPHRL
jgi:hypothetical protein